MAKKNDDFRHISEIYRLEQSFLGLKSLKNKVQFSVFLRSKKIALLISIINKIHLRF